jgi:hypothetical protein
MRIKLFEGFNKDDYYKKLDIIDGGWHTFSDIGYIYTKFNINILKKLHKLIYRECDEPFSTTISIHYPNYVSGRIIIIISSTINIKLSSLNDDYYGVIIDHWKDINKKGKFRWVSETYLCDQFEGLIKLLKDKNFI